MFKSNGSTKYPIICAPMNGVSDARLAIACHNSGIIPSLLPYKNGIIDIEFLEENLKEFTDETNFGTILVACDYHYFHKIFDILLKYKVRFVEILDCDKHNAKEIYNISLIAKEHNIHIYPKLLTGASAVKRLFDNIGHFDYVLLKGPNGAGRSTDSIILEEEIVKVKEQYPNVKIIVSGGINTNEDIKRMLNLGAYMVSMGTMFSTSTESNLSEITKNKIINSSYSEVSRLDTGATQKALVFNKVKENDENNTLGLVEGIKTGTNGHVFIGTGIDYITKIKPVREIVSELTEGL